MAGFFQRLFQIGGAEANAALDRFEDPVKMTQKGILDLEKAYAQAMQDFAGLKANVNRQSADLEKAQTEVNDWQQRAMSLLSKAKNGELDPAQAEDLARKALQNKGIAEKQATTLLGVINQLTPEVQRQQGSIDKLKTQIDLYKNELKTLQARSSAAKAATKLDKQLSGADPSGTINMLERMRDKVEDQEALSKAYAEIADRPQSLEDEINRALESPSSSTPLLGSDSASVKEDDELAQLKAKMGM